MTQVDFYILADSGQAARLDFACRLIEKAFSLSHRIYVQVGSDSEAQMLDDLLWSFRPSSFVPHAVSGQSDGDQRVLIGCGTPPDSHHDLLINLGAGIPEFFSRFDRVSEIVVQDPALAADLRERYGFYRDRGYPLKSHDLRQ